MAGYIQSKSVDATSTLAFTSNVTAHSTLVAYIRTGAASGNVTAVSDNVNGAWTKKFSQDQTTDGHSLDCWYRLNASAGATTVSVTFTTGTIRLAIIEGVVDATNGDAVDTSNSAQGDATNAPSSGTINTTDAVEWLVAGESEGTGGGSITAGTGYTLREQVATNKLNVEEKLTASSGAYIGDFALSGTDNCATGVIAFKAAGGPVDVLMPQILF